MPSDNEAIIRRLLDEVWNKKNLAVIDEPIAPTFVMHDPMAPSPVKGIEGYKQFVHVYQTAFPDLKMGVEHVVSEGEGAAVRWTVWERTRAASPECRDRKAAQYYRDELLPHRRRQVR